ncbi:hypothetical protein [Streptomyces gardneri]|uniref:hypothetical protein n=1 Tax=Streptomyces gardneri TaxID=66892 RepID=UPI0036C10629
MPTPLATAEFSLYRSRGHYRATFDPGGPADVVPIAQVQWLTDCIADCEMGSDFDDPDPYPPPSECRQFCLHRGPPPPLTSSCQKPDVKSCAWADPHATRPVECCPKTHECCPSGMGYLSSLTCCRPGHTCCGGTCCPPGQECCHGTCYWPLEHRCTSQGLCPTGRAVCFNGKCCGLGEECVDDLCTPKGQTWCNGRPCSGQCLPKVGDSSGAKVCCHPSRITAAGCCPDGRPICGGSCCSDDEACAKGACCKTNRCCENAPCHSDRHCCFGELCCPHNKVCGRDPVTGEARCVRP